MKVNILSIKSRDNCWKVLIIFTHDPLLKAKEVLHGDLAISFRLIKFQNDDDNVLDLCKWLATAAKDKRVMPIFAIYSSSGIYSSSIIGDAVAACVVSQVNRV
jgi:hypothetical protein